MKKYSGRTYFRSDSPVRKCTVCREIKLLSEFYKASKKIKARRLDNYCKICRRAESNKNRERFADAYRFVKQAKIIVAKGNLACACCGNKNFQWLQIDHIKPIKRKIPGAKTGGITRKIVLKLIPHNDLQLLCANCNFAKRDKEKCPIDHSLD